jgi:hypothetical protein
MCALHVEVDASEARLDPGRLARIGTHFRRYTDDGRMSGWLVLVSRGGKIAHLETYGRRDERSPLVGRSTASLPSGSSDRSV